MKFLEIESLKVGYGDLRVLQGVSLHVEKGEIVSLVGSNSSFPVYFRDRQILYAVILQVLP